MPEARLGELLRWARGAWPGGDPGPLTAQPVAADGSPRLFARLRAKGRVLVGMAADHPPENRAWLFLARHLASLGLPVARVHAADLERGLFLMDDLGELSLQEAALALGRDEEALARLYEPVLAMLARLQARGRQGLDLGLCFDGAELSPEFLLAREAGYFLEQFVAGACAWARPDWPAGLQEELAEICQRAGQAQPWGLVHRDFQSRNILAGPEGLGLVDFQGARLGPAQYDLAALLNDPYVDLPPLLRLRLRGRYLELRAALGGLDAELFLAGWPFVALSRMMQALGAYAFLTRVRGRIHFAAYVAPALATLRALTDLPALAVYPAWQTLVAGLPPALAPQALAPPGDECS